MFINTLNDVDGFKFKEEPTYENENFDEIPDENNLESSVFQDNR